MRNKKDKYLKICPHISNNGCKMFTHIIHLSDIHIRSGNTEQARFAEFQSVFKRLIEDVRCHPAVINGTAMAVVTGDVFHHKLRIESPGLKLALELFRDLGALCPVYIIRGNHDFRQDKPDEPDLIQSLIHLHNVHYIDETGTIAIDNVGFGIVTIQDLLQKGATSGMSHSMPAFPEPMFDVPVDHKVALFHGNLVDFPVGWIPDGYDVALLGDIHLQHVGGSDVKPFCISKGDYKPSNSYLLAQYSYRDATGLAYGYAGSMIQQDFGEPVLGHGYIIWNLPNKNLECYHLRNDTNGYITVRLNEGKDTWDVGVKRSNCVWQPLAALVCEPWFPRNVNVRVVVSDSYTDSYASLLKRAREDFATLHGIKVLNISTFVTATAAATKTNSSTIPAPNEDVLSFNTPATWVEYVKERLGESLPTDDWQKWFTSPETLFIPSERLPSTIEGKIKDRNAKLNKKMIEYIETRDKHRVPKSKFKFMHLSWDWILCFGNGNWFNFENVSSNDITIVTAKNGSGKTSLLETMCIALYGEGFPSRTNKACSASIICQDKPRSEKAHTSILLKMGDDVYRIRRVFTVSSSDPSKISTVAKETTVDRVTGTETHNLYSGKTAVDEWVDMHVGDVRAFLMSCMITQSCDYDFFNMKATEQKEMLDQALDIESATLFQNMLKEAKTAHSAIIDMAEAHLEGIGQRIGDSCMPDEGLCAENIAALQDELHKIRGEMEYHSDVIVKHGVTFKDLETFTGSGCGGYGDDDDIENIVLNHATLQHELASIVQRPRALATTNTSGALLVAPILSRTEIEAQIKQLEDMDIVPNEQDAVIIHELRAKLPPPGFSQAQCDDQSNDYLVHKYGHDITVDKMMGLIQRHASKEIQQPKYPKPSYNIVSNPRYDDDSANTEENIEELESKLQSVCNEYVELLSCQPAPLLKTPSKVQSMRTRDEIEKEIQDMCSERDVTKLMKLISDLERLGDQHVRVAKNVCDLEKMVSVHDNHPFNPECWACKEQPWKKQNDLIMARIEDARSELGQVKKKIKKASGCSGEIKELYAYIEDLKTHVDNILALQSIRWKEFEECKKRLQTEKLDTEDKIECAKCKLARAWQQFERWTRKRDDLDKDMATLKKVESMLLQRRIDGASLFLLKAELRIWKAIEDNREHIRMLDLKDRIATCRQRILCNAHVHYAKHCELSEKSKQIAEVQLVGLRVKQKVMAENASALMEKECVQRFLISMKNVLEKMTSVYNVFDGFKQWVYTHKVIPCLTAFANNVVRHICDTRPIQIVGKMHNGNPMWFMADGNLPPIEKASGFQKFVLGLSMRIALGRLGASGIMSGMLFIDEGFTACDSDNLQKVGGFLKGLATSLFQDGILLVTHLEDLKASAANFIVVKREPQETSSTVNVGKRCCWTVR